MTVIAFPTKHGDLAAQALQDTVTGCRVQVAASSDPDEVDAIWAWARHLERLMAELVEAAAKRRMQLDGGDRSWGV